jgi:hypothetical protein
MGFFKDLIEKFKKKQTIKKVSPAKKETNYGAVRREEVSEINAQRKEDKFSNFPEGFPNFFNNSESSPLGKSQVNTRDVNSEIGATVERRRTIKK